VVDDGLMVDKAPDVGVKRAKLLLDFHQGTGVGDGGMDLEFIVAVGEVERVGARPVAAWGGGVSLVTVRRIPHRGSC
jgi:hypothetical protein